MLFSIVFFSKSLDDVSLTKLTTVFFCFSLIQAFDGTKLFYVNKYSINLSFFDVNHILSNYFFGFLVSFITVITFYFMSIIDDAKILFYLIVCGSVSISMTPLIGVIEAKGKVYLSALYRGLFISFTYISFVVYYCVYNSIDGSERIFFVSLSVYVSLILREVNKVLKLNLKNIDIKKVPGIIRELSSFIQFNILGVMTSYTERVSLSLSFPNNVIGIFNSQSEVYQRANLVFRVFSAVLNPRLAKLHPRANIVDIGFEISIFIASLTAIFVMIINYNVEYFITLIFNNSFIYYSITFKVGLCLLVFGSVNYISSIVLAIKGYFNIQKNNYLYSFIIYVPSVLLLSHYLGYFGFAISLVVLRCSDIANIFYLSKMSSFKGVWLLYIIMILSVLVALIDIKYELFVLILITTLVALVYSLVLLANRYVELKKQCLL